MTHPLRLQACCNGTRSAPGLAPESAAALAAAAAEVVHHVEGVHVHPRDATGRDSLAADDVDATVAAVRAAAPTLEVGVTTGAWAMPDVDDRLRAIASWTTLPDVASVNWHEPGADEVAAALLDRGVGVEAGIWHAEGLAAWLASPVRDRVTRVLVEVQPMAEAAALATARELVDAVAAASSAPILLHGEDESAWPVLREAARRGLATRMGLEDALLLPDGSVASGNRALVEAAIEVRRVVAGTG
ncbi:3-keto-5-aminohexanoate cleavage protein [Agrococcus jejuensis]|uniref:Uncharacterized conserved protein, DUF849 family n=1 Tax=Agrococcus jejuensis TaxID=399736 RepID=A0A1G8DUK1_9MICO|nr:3-keto-5-aminohexanoate cleavage protein [Agrococcus jejuensis]SDH61372.1 Uncharacterized conserved protein, DUF849 family [Agrococcus jejuensis]